MSIYLDIILLENLLMNYIILFATGIVMKRRIKHTRIIISSLIGSVYAILIYLKVTTIASNIIMKITLSISMVWLAFSEENYKMLLKDLLMFYLVSFIFGGCSFALIYFISPENVKMNNGVLVGLYPLKVTLIAGVVAFVVIQIAFKMTKNKLSTNDMLCQIEIYFDGKKEKVKMLIDSGNMLKDPINGYPVIVVERDKIVKILPEKLIQFLTKIEGGEVLNTQNEYMSKIRLIPFASLGKQNGMLVGIKVEKVKVFFKEKEEYIYDVIVGIYNNKITKDNAYNGLVGLELIEKGWGKYEFFTDVKG